MRQTPTAHRIIAQSLPTLLEPGQIEWSYLYETPDDSPIPPFSVLEHKVITVEEGYRLLLKAGLDGYSAVIIIVKATYDASATAGVRVRWLYSPDGSNFDSTEEAEDAGNYEDLTFSAGATRQRTVLIPVFSDNMRIQIANKDSSKAVTVDAWKILLH